MGGKAAVGWEGRGLHLGGEGRRRRWLRGKERPSFFRIKPTISENNNKLLSDINVLWTAKKYRPESTTLFKLKIATKCLKLRM